jgi:AraC-like DNA-binding protein
MLRDAGVDLDNIDIEGGRASVELIARAWQVVADATGDPAIGARSALLAFNPTHWQSLGLAVLCSSTLRDALNRVVRYHQIITDVAQFAFEEDADTITLRISLLADAEMVSFEAQEFGIAAILTMLRAIFPGVLHLDEVSLTRPEDRGTEDFADLFGCPVGFGAGYLGMRFKQADLDIRLPGANTTLAEYQDRYSRDYIARFGAGSVVLQVREAMLREMAGGDPTQEQVADSLHMSVRSLQRRLQEDGTSFSELLRDLRMQLAKDYLGDTHRQLSEVAYLLGFSDQSNFTRAFKGWFGITPSRYREQPASLH